LQAAESPVSTPAAIIVEKPYAVSTSFNPSTVLFSVSYIGYGEFLVSDPPACAKFAIFFWIALGSLDDLPAFQ